jgi:hypothetical protein
MHRRSLFEQHGKYNESFRIAGDYELLLRELKTNNAYFIPDVIVAAMRIGGISWVPANSLLVMRETRCAAKMHGRRSPGLFWLIAIAKTYTRLLLWNVLGTSLAMKIFDLGRRIRGKPPLWTRT